MTKLLDKAFARASQLEPERQDELASKLLAELSAKDRGVREQSTGYRSFGQAAGLDPDVVKALLKQAVLELLTEQGDVIREMMVEAMEDLALIRAIDEGLTSHRVDRAEVMAKLGAGT